MSIPNVLTENKKSGNTLCCLSGVQGLLVCQVRSKASLFEGLRPPFREGYGQAETKYCDQDHDLDDTLEEKFIAVPVHTGKIVRNLLDHWHCHQQETERNIHAQTEHNNRKCQTKQRADEFIRGHGLLHWKKKLARKHYIYIIAYFRIKVK